MVGSVLHILRLIHIGKKGREAKAVVLMIQKEQSFHSVLVNKFLTPPLSVPTTVSGDERAGMQEGLADWLWSSCSKLQSPN